MGTRKSFNKALVTSKIMIEDYIFKCSNRISPSYFTRSGKMGFRETVLFALNMVNKSLQLELNDFFRKVLKRNESISKQTFSENRQKISPKAFIELNDSIIKTIYDKDSKFKLWNGYRLNAIDGSILEIPNTESTQETFGYIKNQNIKKVARAKASCIFDVENKIILKSKISRCDTSEKDMALELVSELVKDSSFKELILFDRGYPSCELIAKLSEWNVKFVMRKAINIFTVGTDPAKKDQIIKIKYKKKAYEVRTVRFMLESGIEEILLTNIFEETFKTDDFKKLYFKRWGIEIKYDELKNRLEIENFTGITKIAIEQDFYASIYLSNMIELAREESDEIIQNENQKKDFKYVYKTNLNILIGSLKNKLIMLFLEESPRKRNKMYKEIMNEVSKSRIPIRPDRQNPRNKKLTRGKYTKNHKRCL